MLIQNFYYYLSVILIAGLWSAIGIAAILLISASIAVLLVPGMSTSRVRLPTFWTLISAGLVCVGIAFYTSVYEFDEHPETLVIDSLPPGEPNCGTATTHWTKAAYGIGNPCPSGCYRGLTLKKELRLTGFPPWPEYRRELQCWTR